MKNIFLALALFATIGSAAANDGQPGKPAKKAAVATKMQCTKDEKGGASCCAKNTTTTAAAATPAAPEVAKK